tara:strand:- start:405 stop:560 length:156 start_codon:yes stop_codon:yes gene_type:complete
MAKKNVIIEEPEVDTPVIETPAVEATVVEAPVVEEVINPYTIGHATRAYRG